MKLLRTLKESEPWLALTERVFSWAPFALAMLTTGWASFTAGKATPWINAFGPIALIGAVLLGMTIAALAYFFWASARLRHARAAVAFRAAESEEVSVNPLEAQFIKSRIRLDAFIPPVPERVTGKTFSDCDLVGPVILAVLDGTTMANCVYKNCDFVLARVPSVPYNALVVGEMMFTDCRFIHVTFLIHPEVAHLIPAEANWITER